MWKHAPINQFGPHDADRSVVVDLWVKRVRYLQIDDNARVSRRASEGIQIFSLVCGTCVDVGLLSTEVGGTTGTEKTGEQ